ncbi:MAG: MarR family transcriptional regulator [Christensenellales bacterium]|jgi:DNA-binding MarR family transcriptional regulator
MQCEVIGSLYHTMNTINRRQRVPKVLEGVASLNHADMQFIDAVASNPGQKAASLADILGVSRGAVTQWINRLEEMGIVERLSVRGNRKEKRIQLTQLGKEIKGEKDKEHHAANAQMCRFLSGLEPAQLEAIMLFLDQAASLDISPFDCLECCCAIRAGGE